MSIKPVTLVVVDMQPVFEASNEPSVVVGVTKELLQAKEKGWAVIFLEWANSGPTHKSLINLVRGYHLKARIRKADDDGSCELLYAIRRRKFPTHHFRVCGVNTEACVAATVQGLLWRTVDSKIEVVRSACASKQKKKFDWRRYIRDSRLRLV